MERQTTAQRIAVFYQPIDRTYTRMLRGPCHIRWIIVVACIAVIVISSPVHAGGEKLPAGVTINHSLINVRAPEALRWRRRPLRRSESPPTSGISRLGVTVLTTIGGGQQEQLNVASIYVKLSPSKTPRATRAPI